MILLFSLFFFQKYFSRFFKTEKGPQFELATNKEQFQRVAKFTIAISEDIYCNTLDDFTCGDNFFNFVTNGYYTQRGKEVFKVNGHAPSLTPKTLVFDWDGEEDVNIPKTRVIAIRGTHSHEEWSGNFDTEEVPGSSIKYHNVHFGVKGYFHKNFANTALKLYCTLEECITQSETPIIVTGHSRGGCNRRIADGFNQNQNE